jgi:hypothetical protein
MTRHIHEFECHCGTFNYPVLSTEMNGNYIVECGNPDCKHHHFRTIKKGVITGERHNGNERICDTLHVLPSQTSKTRREASPVTEFRRLEAAGLAK